MTSINKFTCLVTILLLAIMSYFYYQYNFTSKGIYSHIMDRNGYSLHLNKEQVPIEIFIRPEWIPFQSDERIEPKEKTAEQDNTSFWLDEVWNRGNDIYFSFTTSFQLDYSEGALLYNAYLYDDGSSSSPSGEVKLFNPKGYEIPVGQTGTGPEAAFSFGIQPEHYDLIREGFYVNYNGYNLYAYVKR